MTSDAQKYARRNQIINDMSTASIDASKSNSSFALDKMQKAVQLLRVYLPDNISTLMQVTDDMKMGEILESVCAKRVLDPSKFVIRVKTDGKEIEALKSDMFSLYEVKEIWIHPTGAATARKSSAPVGDGLRIPAPSGRRASLHAPRNEIKLGGIDFPETLIKEGSMRKSSSRTMTSISTFFKRSDKSESEGSVETSSPATPKRSSIIAGEGFEYPLSASSKKTSEVMSNAPLGEGGAHFNMEELVNALPPYGSLPGSAAASAAALPAADHETSPGEPGTPGTPVMFHRTRNPSGSMRVSTIKKSFLRGRSLSETGTASPTGSVSSKDDAILLRVQIDTEFTTMKVPGNITLDEILRQVASQFSLNVDEYTIEFQDGKRGDLDRSINFYIQRSKVAEIMVVRGEKTYSTMSVIEDGEEVLVLQVNNGEKLIMAAKPEKLIELATDNSEKDSLFIDTLLLTFRSFMLPADFFEHLIARFNATLPDDPTPEDVEYFEKTKGETQMRVVKLIKTWTTSFWHDFAYNSNLKVDLEEFIGAISPTTQFTKICKEILEIIEQQTEREEQLAALHKSIDSRKKTMESMFEEIEYDVMTKQMCVHNFELFQNIHPIEFLNQIWRKKDSGAEWSTPNLDFFSSRFDRESYWVGTEIVSQRDLKKRTLLLKKFIHIGREMAGQGNFFSMFSIYSGLNLTSVQRLKKTWEALPPKTKQAYEELEKSCDPSRNMKAYRDLLNNRNPPILPFLPIYLKDLTFMNDGNSSSFKNMLNFDKLRTMANRVRDITKLASTPYPHDKIPPIQNYLHKPHVETNLAKLKEESLKCEPQQ